MKYDDASWHYGGDFPSDLPPEAGATHIAMFVAWATLNGLGSDYHIVDGAEDLESLRLRALTPGAWFIRMCDEKFTDEDLDCVGNAFALAYFGNEGGLHTGEGSYLADYEDIFASAPTLYHVEDDWASFDAIAPRILERYNAGRVV